jgi:SAM-dependent methyltransferase
MGRPVGQLFGASWLWLGACSMATYWRYAGPAWGYDAAVAVGWAGWFVGMVAAGGMAGLPALMRKRAERKWRWIRAHLPEIPAGAKVLDLGAGEGFVGEVVRGETGAEVVLADVVDFNRTTLPLVRYDGRSLPFESGQFDLTLLIYVLHHAREAERVLAEARRVTRGPIVVLESVREGPLQHRVFVRLDKLANALRSGGAMRAQEASLHIRSDGEWRAVFERLGLRVRWGARRACGVHRERLYMLKPLLV